MDFDEKRINRELVERAIATYLSDTWKHRPARSAFLMHKGKRLPAKFVLKLAWRELTGEMPASEQLTGGQASVRVLRGLGFDAIYEKPPARSSRNVVKSARREALRRILGEHFGETLCEWKSEAIRVPDLLNHRGLPPVLRRVLKAVEQHRGQAVRGRKGLQLRFDIYLPRIGVAVEFDERQHFTPLRAAALRAYPPDARLGFDKARWIDLCEQIRAGDNSPAYRDEQRAFYDAMRDLLAPDAGIAPVVRIFEEEVAWEKGGGDTEEGREIIRQIGRLAKPNKSQGDQT